MNNKLVFTSTTILDDHLFGGVNYKIDLNNEDDLCIGTVSSAEIVFKTDISTLAVGDTFTSYYMIPGTTTWITEGVFHITSIEKNKNLYSITAYDNVNYLEKIVDDWLNGLTFPMTVSAFATSLCTYCSIQLNSSTFTNSTFSFSDNFTASNITGREIMKYIAQVAAASVYANSEGKLVFHQYPSSSSGTLDNHKYTTLTQNDDDCDVIDKVIVGTSEDDAGVSSGTGSNILKIINNPILYTETASTIQTQVDNIYNVVHAYSYRPMSIEVIPEYDFAVGSKLLVNNIATYVMSKERTGSFKYESTGNNTRSVETVSATSQVTALRGSYAKLNVEVGQISTEVGTKVGEDEIISKINQTPETITIDANKVNLTGYLTITAGDSRYDASGAATAVKDGLATSGYTTVNGSNIHAGTIKLGGNGNGNGVLQIVNASDTQIGLWDKDGITIDDGQIHITDDNTGTYTDSTFWVKDATDSNNAVYIGTWGTGSTRSASIAVHNTDAVNYINPESVQIVKSDNTKRCDIYYQPYSAGTLSNITVAQSGTCNYTLSNWGKIVQLDLILSWSSAWYQSDGATIFSATLPSECKPYTRMFFELIQTNKHFRGWINTDGSIIITGYVPGGGTQIIYGGAAEWAYMCGTAIFLAA